MFVIHDLDTLSLLHLQRGVQGSNPEAQAPRWPRMVVIVKESSHKVT